MSSKYHARAVVTAAGERFASKREYARWLELELLQAGGAIRNLRRQVSYDLHAMSAVGEVSPVKVCRYVADHVYEEQIPDIRTVLQPDGRWWIEVVEDVKGVRTAVYALKKRWMWAEYGIEIREV